MKKAHLFVLVLALLQHRAPPKSSASPAATSRSRASPRFRRNCMQRMRRYQFSRSASFAGWTPDGRITISTRFGNTNQLHVVDKPMGARRQITFFDEPINGGELVADRRAQGHRLHARLQAATRISSSSISTRRVADPVRLTDGRGRAGTGRVVAGRHEVRVPVDGANRRRHRHLRRGSARPDGARRWCTRQPRPAGT